MDPSGNPNRFRALRPKYGVRQAKKPHKSGNGERSLPIDRVEMEMENPKSHQTPNLYRNPIRFRALRPNYGVRKAKKPHKSGNGEHSPPIDRVEMEMETRSRSGGWGARKEELRGGS